VYGVGEVDGRLFLSMEYDEKPFPGWSAILSKRPTLLRFWYRQSPYPFAASIVALRVRVATRELTACLIIERACGF